MSDVKCPYCQHEQEICHDDGQGYDEDENEQYWPRSYTENLKLKFSRIGRVARILRESDLAPLVNEYGRRL